MRRLITYFNALLLGVILGMIFLAVFHAPSSPRPEEDRARSGLRRLVLHHSEISLFH